ncbi:MAG: hypothetical protein SA339_09300 [Methanomassiliicoccus sp.]|nr:hypothetical protein [Methanomassiliicoccus sp.]
MELFVAACIILLVFGTGYLKKREDARIEKVMNGLYRQYGDQALFIDNMRRVRKLAIMGGLPLQCLAVFFAPTVDNHPGMYLGVIGLSLFGPIWFLIFRYVDYVTIATPDFVENIYMGFRHRYKQMYWDDVGYVSFAWNSGYAQLSFTSYNHHLMKVHMGNANHRFRDLVNAIVDHVPENRLDSSFRKYRQEREALKNQ